MNRPGYSKEGDLFIESIEKMELEELRQWIYNRLHGNDPTFEGAPGDQPHYLLVVVYPRLSRRVREDIENVLIDFIREIARDSSTEWIGNAGSELLLMADPILTNTSRKDYLIDLLLEISGSQRFNRTETEVLRYRALQALIALDYHPSIAYWKDLYNEHGESYAPLVLEGLTRTDLSAAFEWLSNATWSAVLERSLLFLMPNLLERYGVGEVKRNLARYWRNYPGSMQSSLEELAQIDGFSIEDEVDPFQEERWVDIFSTMVNLLDNYLANYQHDNYQRHRGNSTEPAIQAIRTLGQIAPAVREKTLDVSGDVEAMWKTYVGALTSALTYRELAPEAYGQLIGQLPLPEVIELTGAILRRGHLSSKRCHEILRNFYGAEDAEKILRQSREDNLQDILPSIVAAFSGRLESWDPAVLLIQEDESVPRNVTSWAHGLLKEVA